MLNLVIFRSKLAVGHHDAIKAEGFQVWLVAEVASVADLNLAVVALAIDALVNPIPDESAQHSRMRVNLVPIHIQIAHCIAHCVGIFACKHRAVVVLAFGNLEQTLPSCILGAFLVLAFWHSRI